MIRQKKQTSKETTTKIKIKSLHTVATPLTQRVCTAQSTLQSQFNCKQPGGGFPPWTTQLPAHNSTGCLSLSRFICLLPAKCGWGVATAGFHRDLI